ncbi:MAG: DUF4349 domain-containing protein [Bacteroidota bacterium]
MNCKKLLPVIILTTFFFSCNRNAESNKQDITADTTEQAPVESNKEEQLPIPNSKPSQSPDTTFKNNAAKTIAPVDWDKKIIKTASLKIEVRDFKSYAAEVYRTVKQYGGYIAGEDQNRSDERSETTITIKVPVDQFEPIVNQFSDKAVKVIERKISTEDVGTQIVDTKSRLEAKRAMHGKYLEFFKDAKNMADVLRVQSDINNLQETMESAAGRINYLNQQAAMSTVVLTFYQPLEGFKPQESPSFLTRLTDAFKTGGYWLGNILVGLISIWPLIIIIALGVFLLKKFTSAKTKQPNS